METLVKKISVRLTEPILSALSVMDKRGLGVLLVVDDEERLVGVVTDGDVRRAVLRRIDLGRAAIREIMNPSPYRVEAPYDLEELKRGMLQRRIAHVPIVDPAGRPIDLFSLVDLGLQRLSEVGREGPVARRRKAKPETILVIGGAGYIGSHLVRKLLARKYRVVVLDRLLFGAESLEPLKQDPRFQLIQGDVRNLPDLLLAFREADAVIHLAALVGDPSCQIDEALTIELNYESTQMIADLCRLHGIERLLFASTCSVYGQSDGIVDETGRLEPLSLYAKTKRQSEELLLQASNGDAAPCILRLGTVFGLSPRPRFDLVVNTMTARALQEGKITVFGGNQWRPSVHVADVAEAFCLCLEADLSKIRGEIFNVGSNHLNRTVLEIAQTVSRETGVQGLDIRDDVLDARNYRVSFDKIQTRLGFRTALELEDGIREIAQALRDGTISNYRDRRYHNYESIRERYEQDPYLV